MNTAKVLESMKTDGLQIDSSYLHGEYRILCDLLGLEAVEKIYYEYCGRSLSLPKKLLVDKTVHSYIAVCYEKGKSPNSMAKEFECTYSWIMKVVKMARGR